VKVFLFFIVDIKLKRSWTTLFSQKKRNQTMCRVDKRTQESVEKGQQFEIIVDGKPIVAYEGETIGAALIASGQRTLRYTNKKEHPRGLYCGIGLCQECRMVINGIANTQACQTLATPGCQVETQKSNKKRGDNN
jgi:hypothetical protein